MATPGNIDDPAVVDKFLAIIRGNSTIPSPVAAQEPIPMTQPASASEHVAMSDFPSEDNGSSDLQDLAGSPENLQGTRAPPPTPASRASIQKHSGTYPEHTARAKDLDPIQEADTPNISVPEDTIAALVILANKSTENLSHSKHAPINRSRIFNKSPSSNPTNKPIPAERKSSAVPIERAANIELLKKMKALGAGSSFQDAIIAQFRRDSSEEDSNMMTKVEDTGQDAEETTEMTKLQETDIQANGKMEAQDPVSESTLVATSGDEEDRENQTNFSSWGAVAPRDGPRSRVRTVVLTSLPATADAALVASLIHGGAIECLRIVKQSNSMHTTARVTFTTGDAADAYHATYPNGLDFKYQGKKYTAFVELGTDVDVVSGLMRGYLESGASRVVRATGAEEDWGIVALNKIASGKGRKVEAVIDTYRGEVRVIVFKFTNIADAVQFKAQLVRDDEWESCNIQFMDDPCEKATGVHLDNY